MTRPLGRFRVLLVLALLVAAGCGGGGAKTEIPDAAKEQALAQIGGSVGNVYAEAASTFGKEFDTKGSRADEPVYGILVTGSFEFQGDDFSTAEVTFDGKGKVLEQLYWVDVAAVPNPLGEHSPKPDAAQFDPTNFIGG